MSALRSGVRVLLVCAVVAMMIASEVDPSAPERDPSHGHIFLGGSALDRARALAWHLRYGHDENLIARPSTLPHQEDEDDGAESQGAHVLSIRGAAGVTVLGSAGGAILALSWSLVPPRAAPGRAVAPFPLLVIESILLVPEPPPRAS